MTAPAPVLDARGLLAPSEFAAVAATVKANNLGMDVYTAERIVAEALAFVAVAADNPHVYVSPSRTVDEGWHALILHTALYAALCDRLGTFVHHYPEAPDPTRHDSEVMARTLALLEQAGHTPDSDLWAPPLNPVFPVAATCSHSPRPGSCSPIEPHPPQ